jgi:hypothetical protein
MATTATAAMTTATATTTATTTPPIERRGLVGGMGAV